MIIIPYGKDPNIKDVYIGLEKEYEKNLKDGLITKDGNLTEKALRRFLQVIEISE